MIFNKQDLLVQRDIYRPLMADSTNKHTQKLINMFRTIKAEGGLGDTILHSRHSGISKGPCLLTLKFIAFL